MRAATLGGAVPDEPAVLEPVVHEHGGVDPSTRTLRFVVLEAAAPDADPGAGVRSAPPPAAGRAQSVPPADREPVEDPVGGARARMDDVLAVVRAVREAGTVVAREVAGEHGAVEEPRALVQGGLGPREPAVDREGGSARTEARHAIPGGRRLVGPFRHPDLAGSTGGEGRERGLEVGERVGPARPGVRAARRGIVHVPARLGSGARHQDGSEKESLESFHGRTVIAMASLAFIPAPPARRSR